MKINNYWKYMLATAGAGFFCRWIELINTPQYIGEISILLAGYMIHIKDTTLIKQEGKQAELALKAIFEEQFRNKIQQILERLTPKKRQEIIEVIKMGDDVKKKPSIKPPIIERKQTQMPVKNNITQSQDISSIINATLVSKTSKGIKTTYIFDTIEEIGDWNKKTIRHKLELFYNVNIVSIEQDPYNRRQVIMTTVPMDRMIPLRVEWNDKLLCKDECVLTLGESLTQNIEIDLDKSPHTSICGSTNSGKSVLMSSIMYQLNKKGFHTILIDFKNGIDYSFAKNNMKILSNKSEILKGLKMVILEINKRVELFEANGVPKISIYNNKFKHDKLSRVAVIFDEACELLSTKSLSKEEKIITEEINGAITTIARVGRCVGIHLFIGTQRADSSIYGGQLKTNLTTRISGYLPTHTDSKVVLDSTDASKINPNIKGRFVIAEGHKCTEFQGWLLELEKYPENFKFQKNIIKTLVDLITFEINRDGIRNSFRIAK